MFLLHVSETRLSPKPGPFHISSDLQRMAQLWHLQKVRSYLSAGQDPAHMIAHSLGFLPGKNRVMYLVHGGKSIPWNVTLRGPCGTSKRVFLFSAKGLLLLRLWEGQRSHVPSAHSQSSTQNHSWLSKSLGAVAEKTGCTADPVYIQYISFTHSPCLEIWYVITAGE